MGQNRKIGQSSNAVGIEVYNKKDLQRFNDEIKKDYRYEKNLLIKEVFIVIGLTIFAIAISI